MSDPQQPIDPEAPAQAVPPAFTPPEETRPRWADPPAAPPPPPRGLEPDPLDRPAASAPNGGRGGMLGPLFAVALIAAVMASSGTYLVLDASGALDRVTPAPGGTTAQPASTTTIRIDEDSAITRAAAIVSPAGGPVPPRPPGGASGRARVKRVRLEPARRGGRVRRRVGPAVPGLLGRREGGRDGLCRRLGVDGVLGITHG